MDICRKCHVREARSTYHGLCSECYYEEKEKTRHREEIERNSARALELQEEAAEDAARAARDAAEAKRIARLKTFTCSHCEATFNEEQGVSAVKSPIGKPLCDDCLSALKQCIGCNSYIFTDDKFKKITPIEFRYEKASNEIKKSASKDYCCSECRKTKMKSFFDNQQLLETQYEKQEEERKKIAAEKARIAEEKARIAAEKARIEKEKKDKADRERREKESAEAKIRWAKLEAERKKQLRKKALIFGAIALASSILIGLFGDVLPWSAIAGIVIFILSFVSNKIGSKLLFGLISAVLPNAIIIPIMGALSGFNFSLIHYISIASFILLWIIIGAFFFQNIWEYHSIDKIRHTLLSYFTPMKSTIIFFATCNILLAIGTWLGGFDKSIVFPIFLELYWAIVYILGCRDYDFSDPDGFFDGSLGFGATVRIGISIFAGAIIALISTFICDYAGGSSSIVDILTIVTIVTFIAIQIKKPDLFI